MTNAQIADQFSLLSKLMDIHGENSFKVKSYSIAAYNIEQMPREAADMNESELFGMKGIGESTGKKILEILHNGRLAALDEILERTPTGLLDMLQIKGLGPKKIAIIWRELEIESIGELEYACNENRLVTLKGFGAKTQAGILQSIAYMRQNEGYYLWSQASAIAEALMAKLTTTLPLQQFALTGSIRRQMDTLNVIEIVTTATSNDLQQVFSTITDSEITETVYGCTATAPLQPLFNFYCTGSANFYSTLFETTAGEAFLQQFKQQYALPEAAVSEEAIFEHNKLPYIVPALREDTAILTQAAHAPLTALIQRNDIRGIIHSHSTWSDGNHTIEQMAVAARDKGFEYLVLSDHSQSAGYAGGLKPEQISEQHIEIDALNNRLAPFRIFKSIESDILGDGRLDYTDSVLATFDLVIASVHSNLKMPQERAMNRLLTAIQNPYTTILGHPTGRLLLSRQGYPIDHKTIIDACAEHNVVIEINAHPRRLDLDWRWISYASERGVLLSIDPDAHSINGYDDVHYGCIAAQKGGLTAQHNLSSNTLQQFEDFLTRQQEKRKG